MTDDCLNKLLTMFHRISYESLMISLATFKVLQGLHAATERQSMFQRHMAIREANTSTNWKS